MAENRALAAGQDRRHPPALVAEVLMSDRIDAPVDAVQSAHSDSAANSLIRESGSEELRH
jgi:hypothetical protein